MFKQVVLVMTVGMATLTGCRGSVCEHAEQVYADLIVKVRPCLGNGADSTSLDVESCERQLARCSDAETKAAHDRLDCFEKLGTCSPDDQKPFKDAAYDCFERHQVSKACDPFH